MSDFRKRVMECLGRFPEKVDVDAEIVCSTDKGSYTIKLVRYNVEKDERINAYLLLPKQLKDKNPAIIAAHQHGGEFYLGKSEPAGFSKDSMYHYGIDLCLRGYVVLCPDHLGFEDRRPPEYIREESSHLKDRNYERFLFCKYILNGTTLQAKYISDLSRGIDFLETLDYVDNERIGTIGHSLGGQEALWLTWYEPRIKVGVSSCGFSQIRTILRDGINHNFAMYSFGFLNMGDIGDIVCDIAPKPFMMTNGLSDRIFPVDGVKEIAGAARESYKTKHAEDCFKSIIFEGGHSFPPEVKKEAYNWMDKHLMG